MDPEEQIIATALDDAELDDAEGRSARARIRVHARRPCRSNDHISRAQSIARLKVSPNQFETGSKYGNTSRRYGVMRDVAG